MSILSFPRRSYLAALVLLTHTGVEAAKVDLSPAAWPAGDLEHYTELQNRNDREHPPVRSPKGIVVGTTGALAVRSGVEALRQGGNAADAALTTSLAQVTLMAGATVSFAGTFSLVYYDAATGEVSHLDASWEVPRNQVSGDDIPECGTPSGRQVLVPGFMAAIGATHERFGSLPFKALFGPARYFAREGFEVFPMLASWLEIRSDELTRLAGGREIFLKPDGTRYGAGDWFRQPKLAKTLKRVSRKGARYMYTGAWARKLVRVVQAEGGRLTLDDLADYEPLWIEPKSFRWAGHQIHTPNLPDTGGLTLETAFNGLSAADLRAAGRYTQSVDALVPLLEGVERAYYELSSPPGGHSDGVIAIDADGNVAAVLHTINARIWGQTGIFIDGVSISDAGCWSRYEISIRGPGGRIDLGTNPLVVTRGGEAVAASSAVGSAVFEVTLFSLANLLGYRMTPQAVVDTPTFHLIAARAGRVVHQAVVGDFAPDLLQAARDRGFLIDELPESEIRRGWWIGATVNPRTGQRRGATVGAWNGHAGKQ